jgi:hypothetical protein
MHIVALEHEEDNGLIGELGSTSRRGGRTSHGPSSGARVVAFVLFVLLSRERQLFEIAVSVRRWSVKHDGAI